MKECGRLSILVIMYIQFSSLRPATCSAFYEINKHYEYHNFLKFKFYVMTTTYHPSAQVWDILGGDYDYKVLNLKTGGRKRKPEQFSHKAHNLSKYIIIGVKISNSLTGMKPYTEITSLRRFHKLLRGRGTTTVLF